jgi:methyl-accepting chemotaxis protein
MSWRKFKLPSWVLETVPVLVGVSLSFIYFVAVLPAAKPLIWRYILTALILAVLMRIPAAWYYKTRLLPAVKAYKSARRSGAVLGRAELARAYKSIASLVPRAQIASLILWACSVILLLAADRIWLVGTPLSAVALLFTSLIIVVISLAISYFMTKSRVSPLLEEIQELLPEAPGVDRWRVSFRRKVVVTLIGVSALAFMAFGALVYSKMRAGVEEMALSEGAERAREISVQLSQSPREEWPGVLSRATSNLWVLAVVDAQARPIAESAKGEMPQGALEWLKRSSFKVEQNATFQTPAGGLRVFPLTKDSWLLVAANPGALSQLTGKFVKAGLLFLLATLVGLGWYMFALGADLARSVKRLNVFSGRLASGDLRGVVPVWSDDELGDVSDHLRATFHALRRMVGEAQRSASIVEGEVAYTAAAAVSFQDEVARQSGAVAETSRSAQSVEEGIRAIAAAMETISSATEDVSSAVLEMQASVDEIAGHAQTLSASVEKTASSINEIAASAEEVEASCGKLQEATRDAVSFFSELDAAVEETQRNASGLLESAQKVTADAEEGRTSVSAVEDEVLRSRAAQEESRQAFARLQASMERIGRIVDVIQDVTEQTNLLALNASIIAAGAGEHGRAFGVVATQVRELSGRTAGHAKEIRGVIKSLLESGRDMEGAMARTAGAVEQSAQLSRRAADTLRTILESAASQEEKSQRIASATEELAHGGQSASRNVQNIFEMTEGIARATAEQAKATRLLTDEAERVRAVALTLTNATQEQARGARLISEAVGRMTSDSGQVTAAVQAQGRGAEAITKAMAQLSEAAASMESAALALREASSRLKSGSTALSGEIRKFSL